MREELAKALLFDGDLDGTACKLKGDIDNQARAKIRNLEMELTTAKLIKAGMREPSTSEAYRMADAFMQDFRRAYIKVKPERLTPEQEEIMRLLMDEDEEEGKEGVNNGKGKAGRKTGRHDGGSTGSAKGVSTEISQGASGEGEAVDG